MKFQIWTVVFTVFRLYECQVSSPKICVPEYQTKGEYVCEFERSQSIDAFQCTVVGADSCEAVGYDPFKKSASQPFTFVKVTIQQSKYKKTALTVLVKNSASDAIIESFQVNYFYPSNGTLSINPSNLFDFNDPYASEYQCHVYLSQENYVLSKSGNSDCNIEIPTVTGEEDSIYLFKKTYDVKVKDPEKVCNRNCKVTVSIPDTTLTNQPISKILDHTTFCKEPTLYCDIHDVNSRRITCMIHIPYQFHHIKVISSKATVKLTPESITTNMLTGTEESALTISYKLEDIKTTDHSFEIKFETYQGASEESEKVIHSKEFTFKYVLTSQEKPYISCVVSDTQPPEYESTRYICNMLSKAASIQLSIDPSNGYQLDVTSSNGEDFHQMKIHRNVALTIEYRTKTCNQYNNIEIKFEEDGSKVFTTVPHLTTCPEPVVACYKHNTISRTITCNFDIKYPITQISVATTKSGVSLNSATIDKSNLKDGILRGSEIIYTVNNLLDQNTKFPIKFEFQQSGSKVPHTITHIFKYVLKPEEKPSLSCVIANQEGVSFESKKYTCLIRSSIETVSLIVKPADEFGIVTDQINLGETNRLFSQTGISVTITRKNILCNDVKEIEIEFSDSYGTYKYSDTHITTCPEPTINCKSHDTISRKVACDFKFAYDASEIQLSSTKTHVTLVNPKIEVKTTKNNKFTANIEYQITDYAIKDWSFRIEFRVIQSPNRESYRMAQNFMYVLKEEEKPHIKCRKEDNEKTTSLAFHQNKFSCTLVSRRPKVTLKTVPNTFSLNSEEIDGNDFRNLKKLTFPLILTPNPILCGESKNVEISFDDDSNIQTETSPVTHKYVVNHETICPEPIINCDEHDTDKREVKCQIKIDFPYKDIKLVISSPGSGMTVTGSFEKSAIDSAVNNKVLIKYEVKDWSQNNHRFIIEFKVQHDSENEAYKTERAFTYILKPEEKSFIKCEKSLVAETYFADIGYTCSALSKVSGFDIKTEPADYVIREDKPAPSTQNSVYKVTSQKYVIRPTLIDCNKVQIVKIYFNEGTIIYSDKLTHLTKCPEPTFDYGAHDDDARTIIITPKADYEFASGTFESNTESITLSRTTIAKGEKDGTEEIYKKLHTVSYDPTDLSKDEISFSMIMKLTLPSKSMTKATTKVYQVKLKDDEKPHMKCDHQQSFDDKHFTRSMYKCQILTKNPSFELTINNPNYVLLESSGESSEFKHVYQWNNYKITIQDDSIQCSKAISLDISLTDNNREVKPNPPLKITTTCPDPKVLCDNHNPQSRVITCTVTAEYPYESVQITKNAGSVTVQADNSIVTRRDKIWSSSHTVTYQPEKLLSTNFDFKISLKIKQKDHEKELIVPFTYVILKEEMPQITCEEKESPDIPITKTKFGCYMVKKNNDPEPELTINNTNVILTPTINSHKTFVDLFKWENVELEVEDKKIICDQPINLQLSVKDGNENYVTVIQHQTKCKEIFGNCTILDEASSHLVCNFKSEQAFKLNSFTCSEMVVCTKSEKLEKSNENEMEFMIEYDPLTSSDLVEFDLTVTLAYSEASFTTLKYQLGYSKSHVRVSRSAAQMTNSFYGMALICGVCLVIFIVLVTKKKL